MSLNYKNLWRQLIDRDMTRMELRQATGIVPSTFARRSPNSANTAPSAWFSMRGTHKKRLLLFVTTTSGHKDGADSRPSYLRLLVGQMIAQSSIHQIPLIDLFSAFSALRTPKEMSRMDGMPKVVSKWAREYTDAIRDDESLEGVLRWMFEAGEISISRSGIVSYVDEGSLHAADRLPDVVMDARMALAFMRLDRTQARVEQIRMAIRPEFFRQVREGFYARAA